MIEVRWHGRGGQGVVTVSDLLARAAVLEGKYAQHFPEFGPERSGAPVKAYTRISDKPIELHSGIYSPDIIVVIDPGMSRDAKTLSEGLKEGGKIILNYKGAGKELLEWAGSRGFELYAVDAGGISSEEIGRPIFNIPMLGALLKVTGLCSPSTVENVMSRRFTGEVLEANVKILRKAYQEVRELGEA